MSHKRSAEDALSSHFIVFGLEDKSTFLATLCPTYEEAYDELNERRTYLHQSICQEDDCNMDYCKEMESCNGVSVFCIHETDIKPSVLVASVSDSTVVKFFETEDAARQWMHAELMRDNSLQLLKI